MKSIEHLSSKNQIIDKIKLIKTFKATWEYEILKLRNIDC